MITGKPEYVEDQTAPVWSTSQFNRVCFSTGHSNTAEFPVIQVGLYLSLAMIVSDVFVSMLS